MPENIDYKFLSDLEGGSKTVGYVPAAGVSKSGVTIATGFDLGQRDENDLKLLKLDALLIAKLKPYLGTKSASAQSLLKKTRTSLNPAEKDVLDDGVNVPYFTRGFRRAARLGGVTFIFMIHNM